MSRLLIISGATGGIGSAVCQKAGKGDILVPLYRNPAKMKPILEMLQAVEVKHGGMDLPGILGKISESEWERIDRVVLVMAAFSIKPLKRIEHISVEDAEKNIHGNVWGSVRITLEAFRFSKEKNKPLRIINFDSGAAYRPINGWGLYSAGKAYMNMWLKSLREEESLEIVSFDPGVVDTPMQAEIREADPADFPDLDMFLEYKKNGILNSPSEIAGYVWEHYVEHWDATEFAERYLKK